MTMYEKLQQQLERQEGFRQFPYKDSVGIETIGIGRNLKSVGISLQEAQMLLQNDLEKVMHELMTTYPAYLKLDDARKSVLLNMAFNMGIHGLMQFRQFLVFLEDGKYAEAAAEMLRSKWAEQVPNRAHELAQIVETGIF
jgi:lysozyme